MASIEYTKTNKKLEAINEIDIQLEQRDILIDILKELEKLNQK
jgi:hypothetical protein